MIRVTIRSDGAVGQAELDDAVTLTEALECCKNALLACGYCFNGSLTIEEEA
jgi:hypothetical protein